MKILSTVVLVFLVTGCDRYVIDQELMQESFLVKCPEKLPHDYRKVGEDWLRMASEWSLMYHECAIRHNGTVDAIRIKK